MTDDLSTGQTIFVAASAMLGIILLVLVSIFYLSVVGGIVTASLWNWFIVKQFSLPSMSIPMGIGINIFIHKFIPQPVNPEEPDKKKALAKILGILITPWFILLIGWIVSLYL